MNISLIPLNTKGRVDFKINPDMSDYKNDEIKEINNLEVEGFIIDNGTEDYRVNLHIMGDAILKSAINGSDVPFKLDIYYDDFINNFVEIYKNSTNTLDILPIIWENILLEIPIRAVNKNDSFENTSGEGWEIVEE
jgi:uncharacterized metal-binding protein YceD (DUF177 family)